MASIAIMIGGAIIHATAFVGGNYLAKYLSSDSAGQEKKRHDLAVEKYEQEYQKYQENRTKLVDWIATNDRIKDEAKQNLENTDYALKLYNKTHQDQMDLKEPQFSDLQTKCSTKTGRDDLRRSFGPGNRIGGESVLIKNE